MAIVEYYSKHIQLTVAITARRATVLRVEYKTMLRAERAEKHGL